MKISTKILAITISFLTLTAVTIMSGSFYMTKKNVEDFSIEFKKELIQKEKTKLKENVEITLDTMNATYDEYKQNGVDEKIIKEKVKNALRHISFNDGKGYVFVYDTKGNRIAYRLAPQTEGNNYINVKDPNGLPVIQEIIKEANNGGGFVEYYWKKPGENEPKPKLSYIAKFEPYDWVIGIGGYIDDIDNHVASVNKRLNDKYNKSMMYFSLFILFCAIAGSIIIALLMRVSLVKPLKNMIAQTRELSSGEGDLTVQLPTDSKDEIAEANSAINAFVDKVREMTAQAKSLSNENSSISHELSTTSLEVGKLSEQSVEIIDEATAQTQNVKNKMETGINEASKTKDDLNSATEYLLEATDSILKLSGEIQTSAATELELAQKIQQLSSDAQQVQDVLTVISDIADQTNLLALNAAIEAARAGEHGRGFAVVADEVRKLAERTQKSLTEINATISVIMQNISNSSEEMNLNSKKIEELSNSASEVEHKIKNLSEVMAQSTKMAELTVNNYLESGNDIQLIAEKISEINEISAQNARSMEEVASASEHLDRMTEQLTNKLNEFKTN